jgi:hypothetical protein
LAIIANKIGWYHTAASQHCNRSQTTRHEYIWQHARCNNIAIAALTPRNISSPVRLVVISCLSSHVHPVLGLWCHDHGHNEHHLAPDVESSGPQSHSTLRPAHTTHAAPQANCLAHDMAQAGCRLRPYGGLSLCVLLLLLVVCLLAGTARVRGVQLIGAGAPSAVDVLALWSSTYRYTRDDVRCVRAHPILVTP